MGAACSCKDHFSISQKKDDKSEIQIHYTTTTDRKESADNNNSQKKEKGSSDEEINEEEEIKDLPLADNQKSEFQINKEQQNEGFTYLPFETKNKECVTLTKHLLTKKISTYLKDSFLDFTLILSQLQQGFLQIQDRIARRHAYYTGEKARDNKLLQEDCCQLFEDVLRESELCCVTYCIKRDKLEKYIGENSSNAKYVIMFTGLDNSTDPENNCGSLFAIWKRNTTKFRPLSEKEDILQSCNSIIASGYCMYGQCMNLILAINTDVNGFSYDVTQKEFILTHPKIKAAQRTGILSVDTSKEAGWEPPIKIFINRKYQKKDKKLSLRYTGSLVADAHRTLLYGGILMYPLTNPNSEGDVSLIEAFVLGYIFEKSWGRASQGEGGSVTQMKLYNLQQKTQFYCGTSAEVVELENVYLSIARRQSINKSIPSRFSSNQSIGLNGSLDLSVKSVHS
ncbi:hypothetical protein ABPG72_016395 [Tetrahymena utriculariae]